MKVIDRGHKYELLTLDGELHQELQFVQRICYNDPKKFPGNRFVWPGTTLQSVIRALLERVRYLDNQHSCFENWLIIKFLRGCLWLLEFRAARRHKRMYLAGFDFAEYEPMCPKCGHTICEHRS
jgi:hypothetical protein